MDISLRETMFKLFDGLHALAYHFELNCLRDCQGNCEDGAILLLPYENEYLSAKARSQELLFPSVLIDGIPCGFIAEEEPNCRSLGLDLKTCSLHPFVPLDCMTYPVFPVFQPEHFGDPSGVSFYLSKFCPLYKRADLNYLNFTKKAWMMFMPYISKDWMAFYNEKVTGFFTANEVIHI